MKLITIKELSEYLKIKQSTLYAWAGSGMIPSYKLNGVLRFDKDEIEEWIKAKKVGPFKPRIMPFAPGLGHQVYSGIKN